ncbi:MAG: phage/plasmid primase, P4 family, partial [Candidatus Nitrosocaldaceae archaeon]
IDHIPINHYYNDEKEAWNKTPYKDFPLDKHYSYNEYSRLEELEEYITKYNCNTFAIRLGKLRSSNYIIGIDCDSKEYSLLIDHYLIEEGLDTMKEHTPRGMHFYFLIDGGELKSKDVINLAQYTNLDIKLYFEKRYFIHIDRNYQIINGIDKIKYIDNDKLLAIISILERIIRLSYALAKYYSNGQRDYLWFYLSAVMKNSITLEEALKICRYVCYFFKDEELKSRLTVVEETYKKENVKGIQGLRELGISDDVIKIINEIFNNSHSDNINVAYMFVCKYLLSERKRGIERALFVDDYRYVIDMDEWIRWDKNIWIREYAKESLINDFINYCEEIKRLLKCINYDEECKRHLEHFIYVTKSKSSIDELIATLSIFLSIDSKSLNSIPDNIILAKNCAIEVNSNKIITLEEVKRYYPTKAINCLYDENAKCDKFREFILTICNNNREKALFLVQLLGSFLLKRREEKAFIFYGSGANGKSTLMKVMSNILGDYMRYSNISMINANEVEGKNPELIESKDKHLVCISEPKQVYLNDASLKAITSLEPKSVRALYHHPIEITPNFNLVIMTNNKPIIHEFTLGMLRRLVMINFDYVIPEEKRIENYADILLEESSGILNLMIAALQRVMKEGLTIPNIVKSETSEWLWEIDNFTEFVDKYLVITYNDNDKLEFPVVYEYYKTFCKVKGIDIITKQLFSKRLRDRGLLTDHKYERDRDKVITYLLRCKFSDRISELSDDSSINTTSSKSYPLKDLINIINYIERYFVDYDNHIMCKRCNELHTPAFFCNKKIMISDMITLVKEEPELIVSEEDDLIKRMKELVYHSAICELEKSASK